MDETKGDLSSMDQTKKGKTTARSAGHPGRMHTAVPQQHDNGECLASKDNSKQHISLVGGSCAAGTCLPAMVIYSCPPTGSIPVAATQGLPVSTTVDRTVTPGSDTASMFTPPHTHPLPPPRTCMHTHTHTRCDTCAHTHASLTRLFPPATG